MVRAFALNFGSNLCALCAFPVVHLRALWACAKHGNLVELIALMHGAVLGLRVDLQTLIENASGNIAVFVDKRLATDRLLVLGAVGSDVPRDTEGCKSSAAAKPLRFIFTLQGHR